MQGIGAVAGIASSFVPGTPGKVLSGVSNIASTYVSGAYQVALGRATSNMANMANWVSIGTTVAGLVIGGKVGKCVQRQLKMVLGDN